MFILRALLLAFIASLALIPAASMNAVAFCEIVEPPSPLPTQVNGTHVEIQLTEGYARIVIIKEFHNPSGIFKEGQIFFPLEKGHELITDLRLKVGDVVYESSALDRSEALGGFLEALATEQDAALVQYDPVRDVYWVAVTIPPRETRTTVTTLEMPLAQRDGFYAYHYRLSVDAGHSLDYLRVHVRVETSSDLQTIELPSHPGLQILRAGDRTADVFINSTAEAEDHDLEIRFRSDGTSIGQHVDEETGHRYLRFSVDASDPLFRKSLRPLPRAFLFVIDGSGSMGRSDRWSLARDSVSLLASDLGSDEKYAVAVFRGAEVEAPNPELRTWSPSEGASIRGWLDGIQPQGSTNLALALGQVRAWALQAWAQEHQPFLFLVSDGEPTTSRGTLQIESAFRRASYQRDLPVYALGIRPDSKSEENLLRNLSHYNGGDLVMVGGSDLSVDLGLVLDALRVPVLHDVRFTFPEAHSLALASPSPQRVLEGDEALAVAQLSTSYRDPVVVEMSWTGPTGETRTVLRTFPEGAIANHTLVERQWVLTQVHALLDKVLGAGNQRAMDELKEFATDHRVVTPYTSLLVTVPRSETDVTSILNEELSGSNSLRQADGAASTGFASGGQAPLVGLGLPFGEAALLNEGRKAELLRRDLSNPLVEDHEVDRYVVAGSVEHKQVLRDRTITRFAGTYLTILEANGELIGVTSGPLTPTGMVLSFAWNGATLVLFVLLLLGAVRVHQLRRRTRDPEGRQ